MLPINNESFKRDLVKYRFLVNKRFLARTAGDNESEHAEYVQRKTRTGPRKFSVTDVTRN